MNKTEFIQLIQNPDLPAAKHVAALKQIVADFPYFTQARVLLAKALHNEKHYEYEKFLKQTALAVPDRDVLYHYLHNLTPQWQSQQTAVKIEQPIVVVQKDVAPEPGTAIEQPVNLPEEFVEESVAVEEDIEVAQTKEELDVDLAITTLLEGSNITPPQKEVVLTHVKSDKEIIESVADTIDETYTNNELPEAKPLIDEGEEEELSFVEWLQRKNNSEKKIETKPEANPVIPEIKVDKTPLPQTVNSTSDSTTDTKGDNKKQESTIPPVSEVTKAEIEEAVAKSNVNDFQNILDKFIKENPSISRPKAEFFNPVNMARQSVEEDEELVTETLANLLYKQGNFKKAIRAYEKLCLLYPSKMTYFASLIQKIKTELKD
ncbi:MAG: tetratricopeptide repeat protein [Bacteroidia bacterium]